jgi:two-component system, NarL family, response regulator DevR
MSSGALIAVVSALTGVIITLLTAWLVWLQIIDRRQAVKPDPDSGGSTDGAGDASRPSRQAGAPLRVMVVEDHQFVRESISRVLKEEGTIVVAEEASVRGAIDSAGRSQPDVIVMDIRLPDGSGIEATREIRNSNPRIRVLMLTASDDDEALISSIMAGANGYVRKQKTGSDQLVNAVRAVGEGRNLIDPDMIGALLERLRGDQNVVADRHNPASGAPAASGEQHAQLSAQEDRVLSLVAEGLTNRRITAELGVSEKTVRSYVSSILGKLGVSHRSDPAAHPDRSGTGHHV